MSTNAIERFTRPGYDRDVARAMLSQASHRGPGHTPLNDIQVQHLLRIGYMAGRADADKALRLAAEREVRAGNTPTWLQPGAQPRAADVWQWLTEWAADVAKHGPTQEETP